MVDPDHCGRRTVLRGMALTGLAIGPGAWLVAGCGMRDDRPEPQPERGQDQPDWTMGEGMGPGTMADMRDIHDLLVGHAEIAREVEDIDGGIRARTTSSDPQLAELIRSHVAAMRSRVEDGEPIRAMDPLFREIFEHHDSISIEVSGVPGGVDVTETSPDPQVQLLIRQHARRAVSEFVADGMSRAREPTPLPDGYQE